MTVEYRLTQKEQGIFLKRVHGFIELGEEIQFIFKNAPLNLTVIFKSENRSIYRTLSTNGECSINEKLLNGVVEVFAFTPNHVRIWNCEKLYVSKKNDVVMVVAEDVDFSDSITKLKVICDELYDKIKTMEKHCDELDSKLTEILEGYDII